MIIKEELLAFGHPNILGTHKSTFEFTKEKSLTKRGDCIIGIAANKGLSDFSERFKAKAKKNIEIKCVMFVNNLKEEISGYGNKQLSFLHPFDIVIRKSDYICSRTLMIKANKSASDLNREFIESLKNPKNQININFIIDF